MKKLWVIGLGVVAFAGVLILMVARNVGESFPEVSEGEGRTVAVEEGDHWDVLREARQERLATKKRSSNCVDVPALRPPGNAPLQRLFDDVRTSDWSLAFMHGCNGFRRTAAGDLGCQVWCAPGTWESVEVIAQETRNLLSAPND